MKKWCLSLFFLGLSSNVFALNPGYTGGLYDTHHHPTDEEENLGSRLNRYIDNLDRNNIQFVLPFDSGDDNAPLNAANVGKLVLALPGRVLPFFKPNTGTLNAINQNITSAIIRDIFRQYPFLAGTGEYGFYRPPFKDNIAPNDTVFMQIYPVLAELGKVIMIHPNVGQATQLSSALANNPNTTFLVHGLDEIDSQITTLMANYPNFYFTVDTANLIRDENNGPLMFSHLGTEAQDRSKFVSYFDANADLILSSAVAKWRPRIEAYPTRFMWGTDAAFNWHFESDIYDRLITFSRSFIAQLSTSTQNLYAIANATTVFQSPPTSIMNISQGDAKVVGGFAGFVNPVNVEKFHILATPTGAGTITVSIYNRKGRLIDTFSQATNGSQTTISWSPGESVGSGIYMFVIEGPGIRVKRKAALVRSSGNNED